MSKFRLNFTLKQHTPIIHFQSDQSGATLRATELKPKLDRFLLENVEGIPFRENANGSKSLDYKVIIVPKNSIEIFDIAPEYKHFNYKKKEEETRTLPFPTFFASIDKEWKEKSKKIKFSLTNNHLLTIITFNENLKSAIEKNISLFFYLHNFGMRQSKGFGSFTIENGEIDDKIINSHYYIDIDINYLNRLIYQENKRTLKFNKELSSKFLEPITPSYENNYLLFKAIDLFYKTLRSGINFNKFYFKSLMFLYAKERLNTQWDKKLFKSTFLLPKYINEQTQKHNNSNCKDILTYSTENKYLLRDCLGLSTIQEYNYSREYRNSEKFTIRHPSTDLKKLDRFKKEEINPNSMVRFQSPLLIKPILIKPQTYRVFLIPKEYPENIFDENITILKIKNNKVENKIDDLKLYPNFNLQEYLDFAFSKDIKQHIERCGTNSSLLESQLLIKIYTQLNKQQKERGVSS